MKKNKKLLSIMTVLLLIVCMAVPVSAATKISKKKATLKVGQTLQLKVTGTKKKPKWTSSKKSVATVSSKGRVKAKKKGTATITAKVGKKKYTCKITVKKASTGGFNDAPSTPAQTPSGMTMGQKNALEKAKSYLRVSSFSYDGLIHQLEFNGFTKEQAEYGVTKVGY